LALLVLLNVVDAFHLNVVWPMLPFAVRDFGVAEVDVGFYCGVIGAAAPLGALLSAYQWGKASDKYGRRPALLAGSALSTASVFVFGTAKSVGRAAAGRFLSGLLNGNAAIVKTYLGETCTKKAQSEAFGVLALGYGLASTLAPAASGFLQRPARRWPETFAGTTFDTYPYLLPMVVAACLTGLGAILGGLLLPETASFVRRAEAKATARDADEEKRLVKLASAGDLRAIELRDVDEWSDVTGDKGDTTDDADVAARKEVLFTPETTRAVACYAVLAAIAIGYDEMLPVFLKTTKALGGCGFAPRDIGILLICGGVTLLVFQLVLYPRIADALGAVRAFRFGVALFAGVSMLAPFASVMPNEITLWMIALASQCTKICALGIGFVSITIVVNNSCDDAVKARVNGISGTTSAFARIVAPVICGWTFTGAMRLRAFPARQFIPFAFICAVTVALRVIAERLPQSLDSPKSSIADVDALPSDDLAHATPIASDLDSPC
jgi:diphthamide biosynthesis protein 2